MGFSTEIADKTNESAQYIFYANNPKNEVPSKLVEQPEECYICHGDGPLFYLCVCKNYGRCKTCTLEAYSKGDQTCTICNEKYVYETEIQEIFNYSHCVKDCCKICMYTSITCLIFAFWAFLFIGFSYGETFYKVYDLYATKEPIYGILIASYFIGGVFNFIAFGFWAIAPWATNSPFKFKSVTTGYLSMLLFHQTIGIICIYAVTGEFLFNIVSMMIGSFFAVGTYILTGFCFCVFCCFYNYKKELMKTYTEHKKTIKLPTSN